MKFGRRIAVDGTVRDTAHMCRAAGVGRFAWNWGLARWNEDTALAKTETDPEKQKALWPSVAKLRQEWAKVRRVEFPWSLEVTKCAGTQALMDLGATFARAHKERREAKAQGRKPRKMFGFPKFKARNKVVPGFALWNDQFSLCAHHSVFGRSYSTISVPNLGMVKLRELVPNIGGILGARFSFRRGRWFVAIQFDTDWMDGEASDKSAKMEQARERKAGIAAGMSQEEAAAVFQVTSVRPKRVLPRHPNPDTIGGADVGLIDAAVIRVENAKGEVELAFTVPNPRRMKRTEKQKKQRKRRERKLSRSIQKARVRVATERKLAKGDATPVTHADLKDVRLRLSKRQQKQSRQLSGETWAMADMRNDFLHKLSHTMSRSAEIMVLEDLHVAGMMQNPRLAPSLSDAAMGKLGDCVAYKTECEGGLVLWAPRFFASSKRCSACGHVHAELKLSDRTWTCQECGATHDRDGNAAANLCALGQLAAGDGPVPLDMAKWSKWIAEARERVSEWREAKAYGADTQQGSASALLEEDAKASSQEVHASASQIGMACPEFKRGERADRAWSNPGRGARGEPRTKTVGNWPDRGERAHLRSPFG